MAGQAHLHSLSAQARAVSGILFLGTTLAFAQDDYGAHFNSKSTKPPPPPSDTTITSEAHAGQACPQPFRFSPIIFVACLVSSLLHISAVL